MKGFLLIDKEKGMSSFDVVKAVRRLTGEKKVGHSGTLDPLATGLLLVAVGEATKILEYFVGCDKEYEVLAEFGKISDTYDAEGKIESLNTDAKFSKKEIENVIKKKFLGEIDQIPPKFSALKINGKRAYEMAREGKEVLMKARPVQIYSFNVIEYKWPFVRFQIKCGSGTYVRSLVNDLGQELKCGGYVVELRRSCLGGFVASAGCKLDDLNNNIEQRLVTIDEISDKYPSFDFTDEEYKDLGCGKILNKKVELKGLVFAKNKGKVFGVLEATKIPGGIKIRKMIL